MILHAAVLAFSIVAAEKEPTPQLYLTAHQESGELSAVGELRSSLHELDYAAMLTALTTLNKADGSDATSVVLEALQNSDPRVRWQAARAAGRLQSPQQRLIAGLLNALKDSDPLVRWSASESLVLAGARAKSVVPNLVEGLTSKDLVYRRASAEVLAKLGPHASEAVPSLFDALRDDDPTVRRWASHALRQILRIQIGNRSELEDLLTDDRASRQERS